MEKLFDLTQMQKLVEKAEQIAGAVKDSQLKQAAFERILSFLLHSDGVDSESSNKVLAPRKVYKTSKKPTAKKNTGTMIWLEELKEEKCFEMPKNSSEILTALEERGHHLKPSDLTRPLQQCTKRKILRRKKMALAESGKQVWHYSNW